MSLNKTKIEWTDYTWNPVTGCLHGCPYCYARGIANRFKGGKAWPNGFEPMFHSERMEDVSKGWPLGSGKKIFVCSMADLFGDWVPDEWIRRVIEVAWDFRTFTNPPIFQFLTKNPARYEKFIFPENCWLGMSLDGSGATDEAYLDFIDALQGKPNIRFVSVEPFRPGVYPVFTKGEVDWVIVGAQSGPGAVKPPEMRTIIDNTRKVGAALFLKNSIAWSEKIREFPAGRVVA